MNKQKCKSIYSKQLFLNPDESPYIGSVAAFLGYFLDESGKLSNDPTMWLRIGDCHNIVCLHKGEFDYTQDYIDKLSKLRDFIDDYIDVLVKFRYGQYDTNNKSTEC